MKAPLSKQIKDILSDKDNAYKLMRTVIAGKRDGSQVIEIDGKSLALKRVDVRNVNK